MKTAAVVVAAGRGERLPGEIPKQFLDLGGKPLLAWSCRLLHTHPRVDRVVVVVPADVAEDKPAWLDGCCDELVAGGATRRESVVRGLESVGPGIDRVLIHDGVRPFLTARLVDRVLGVDADGGVIPVVPVADTLKVISPDRTVRRTLGRSTLGRAQTPQAFPLALILRLHREAAAEGVDAPDDAFLCERAGVSVATVEGEPSNLKITTEEDLHFARWLIDKGATRDRVAMGGDHGET